MAAFTNVGYYMYTYATLAKRPLPKLSNAQLLILQAVFKNIKDKYDIPHAEMKALVNYAFLHNPLKFDDIKRYGEAGTLNAVATFYKNWKKYNTDLIQQQGLRNAILNSRPQEPEETEIYLREIFNA